MNLTEAAMKSALECLDRKLDRPVRLIVGGGGAMILAHHFSLATSDIDAIPAAGASPAEVDVLVKQVAQELKLPPDWLNPYYSTFTHVLPGDYGTRLETVQTLSHLTVQALSKTDLLIMKCFAGRLKDRPHAKVLIENGADVGFAEEHIENLRARRIPNSVKALDFLDEVLETVSEKKPG